MSMASVRVTVSLSVCLLVLCCCSTRAQSYEEQPFVCISDGCMRGTTKIDNENQTYSAYLGIPYAKPPLGALRFANPVPKDPWNVTYDATSPKPVCPQKLGKSYFGEENCLYLNVFIPQRSTFENAGLLPVMFYIHGGAFSSGGANNDTRDPVRLMTTRRVIVVAIQYRLGVLGFLSTGDLSAPGNFGMKDQVLAMRWVQKNIHAFGGDPRLVTIFGESAGGASVQYHMISPMSRGLFQRAISMSGSALSLWSVPMVNPLKMARKQAKDVGIMDAYTLSTAELISKLRTTPAQLLVANISSGVADILFTVYRPTIEPREAPEPFLVEDPRDIWNRGDYKAVPWLTGAIPTDGSVAVQKVLKNSSIVYALNAQFIQQLPLILSSKTITRPMIQELRHRFYHDNNTAGPWISEHLYQQATQLISESWFLYPLVGSLKQHLANRKPQPTSVYSFEFKGRQSYSAKDSTGKLYGLTHGDEIIYIFRTPFFFPVDFPVGSPEAEMSRRWIKYLIDFASTRSAGKVGTCIEQSCSVVRFKNTNSISRPVLKMYTSGLDEEMFKFWSNYYKTGGSY